MSPPPPGPPPPPAMPAFSAAQTGNQRDLLLLSIRQGAKLKKTVTVDKSGPFISGKFAQALLIVLDKKETKTTGKVHCGTNSNSIHIESSRDVISIPGSTKQQNTNSGPPNLSSLFAGGMPKLKPTGLNIGSTKNLTKEISSPRSLSSETKNRGPPPQPPPASHKPQIPSSASDSVLTSSHPVNNTVNRSNDSSRFLPNKPTIGGYGKPNVAPKPPVVKEPSSPQISFLHQQSSSPDRSGNNQNLSLVNNHIDQNKPSPPPKKISLNGRPGVNRAQSMRVPRSPPVAPTTNPPFPPNHKHNLVKNQSSLHQSQDGLNGKSFVTSKTGTLPHNFQKMAILPPNIPPPPAPNQRTPTRPPVSKPPPPPSRPAPPPAPPPPPPHRTSPAPPPPALQGISTSVTSCSGPPAPPVRNLSVRNGSFSLQTEIESKFAHLFHNIQEFPDPGVFRNLVKNYNTKASAIAKQPAPPPPIPATTVQLGNKMWVHNASHC